MTVADLDRAVAATNMDAERFCEAVRVVLPVLKELNRTRWVLLRAASGGLIVLLETYAKVRCGPAPSLQLPAT